MTAFLVEVNWPPLASNEGSFSACFPTYEVSISVYGSLWNSTYADLSQLRTTPPPTCPVFWRGSELSASICADKYRKAREQSMFYSPSGSTNFLLISPSNIRANFLVPLVQIRAKILIAGCSVKLTHWASWEPSNTQLWDEMHSHVSWCIGFKILAVDFYSSNFH